LRRVWKRGRGARGRSLPSPTDGSAEEEEEEREERERGRCLWSGQRVGVREERTGVRQYVRLWGRTMM
jgi:hypothetical protein